MKERFKLIISVYVLFVKDEKILMLRRANTGWEDGNYSLVAGHADGNEALTEATIREAKEESGVKIEPADLQLRTHLKSRPQAISRIFPPRPARSGECNRARARDAIFSRGILDVFLGENRGSQPKKMEMGAELAFTNYF